MKMPKLRFKADDGSDFPEWESFVLNEVCNYSTSRGNGKNYVSTENMLKDFAGVNISPDKEANGVIYKLNDILLSNIRPYLKKAWLANCNGVCSSDVLVLHPINVEPCLLYYLIANDIFINYVMMSASGTKMPRGDKTSIMNWKLALPCHEEQRKIANFLLAVDSVIDKQQTEIEAWEQYKKGVAQKLFSQEVRFKADDGSDFPNWECKTLGELGTFYGGLSGKSKEDFVDGTCPYITYKNVYLNTFATPISDDKVKIKPQERQNKVKQFDVLFTQSSETFEEVGLSSVYLYDDEPYLNSFCKGFRFNNLEQIYPKFIGHLLRSDNVRHDIILMGQGISRINLRTQYLSKLNFKLPSQAEQRKIAECLDAIDDVIALAKAELEKWRELKKGLLQQLFV